MKDSSPVTIDRLVRSRRKTIALIVDLDGSLTVRAPFRLPQPMIEAFVQEKAAWVREKQEEARQQRESLGIKQYIQGELFWFLGNQYPLEIIPDGKAALVFEGKFKLASQSLPQAQEAFIRWYRTQARQVIEERVALHAKRLGLAYRKVRISNAQKRWGSCSSNKNLSFAWRLVMAPLPVVDYVVIHELCHLIEPNHSRAFWTVVETALPDYKTRRDWLRKNGQLLELHSPSDILTRGRR